MFPFSPRINCEVMFWLRYETLLVLIRRSVPVLRPPIQLMISVERYGAVLDPVPHLHDACHPIILGGGRIRVIARLWRSIRHLMKFPEDRLLWVLSQLAFGCDVRELCDAQLALHDCFPGQSTCSAFVG